MISGNADAPIILPGNHRVVLRPLERCSAAPHDSGLLYHAFAASMVGNWRHPSISDPRTTRDAIGNAHVTGAGQSGGRHFRVRFKLFRVAWPWRVKTM